MSTHIPSPLHTAALSILIVCALGGSAAATTFTVESVSEALDAAPGDGVCATASGTCTVRAALEEANVLARAIDILRPALADPSMLLTVRGSATRAGPRAPTTTFTVDTTADAVDAIPGDGVCAIPTGGCSLRAAIMEANDLEGLQAITLPAGHFALTRLGRDEDAAATGDLDVLGALEITGAGAMLTTVDAGGIDRVFDNLSETFTLTGVEVSGGDPEAFAGFFAGSTIQDGRFVTNGIGLSQRGGSLTMAAGYFDDNVTGVSLTSCLVAIDDTIVEKSDDTGFLFELSVTGTLRNVTSRSNAASGIFLGLQNEVTLDRVELSDNDIGLDIGFPDAGNTVVLADGIIERNGTGLTFEEGSLAISTTVFRDNTACAVAAGGVGFGDIEVRDATVERNGCGIAVDTAFGGYVACITDTIIVDNVGAGVLAAGSTDGTSVRIARSTVARNGGGVLAVGVNGAGPVVTIVDTTIASNRATNGAGIQISRFGTTRPTVTVVNSTVSGNVATGAGGGIFNDAGDLDLRNVTLAANQSAPGTATAIAIANDATAGTRNSIVAGSCTGPIGSAGHNLVADPSACTLTGNSTGNLAGDPLLGVLADNGGPTPTHALGTTSPARNAGNPTGCVDAEGGVLAADQRGVSRPQFGRCDIGAFEAACGNGALDLGETCDDGNDLDDDCCASCRAATDGASCSDGDACTVGDTCHGGFCTDGPATECGPCETCDGNGGCLGVPRTGCRQPTEPMSGELEIGVKPIHRIEWFWVQGEATTREEFGDPLAGDDYAFCLFDESQGTPRVLFYAATRSDPCGKKSCWRRTGKTGFQYGDPKSDALRKVVLKSGREGKAKVVVTAKGRDLAIPALPVSLPLRAQLQADNGQCWESQFVQLGVSKNDAKLFRGKASQP